MSTDQFGRELLAFDRLRFGTDLNQTRHIANDYGMSNANEYTDCRAAFNTRRNLREDDDLSSWDRLIEDALFALERVAPNVAIAIPVDDLHGRDSAKRHAAFFKIQAWVRKNPKVQETDSTLAFLALLPDSLGGSEFGSRHAVKNQRMTSAREALALELCGGRFPDMNEVADAMVERVRDDKNASTGWFGSRAEIVPFLRLTRAAMARNLPRWRAEQDSRDIQILERGMDDAEFFLANPLAVENDQVVLDRLLSLEPILSNFVPSLGSGDHRAAWPVLLHELWFDPTELKKQWMEASGSIVYQVTRSEEFHADPEAARSLRQLLRPVDALFVPWDPKWDAEPWLAIDGDAITRINTFEYELAQGVSGESYRQVPDGPTVSAIRALVREWIWDTALAPMRETIGGMVRRPGSKERAAKMAEGQHKAFLSYLSFLNGPGGRENMVGFLNETKPLFTDGAKLNRSQDLMNGYVRGKMFDQNRMEDWRIEELVRRGEVDGHVLEELREYYGSKKSFIQWNDRKRPWPVADETFDKWREEHKRRFAETSKGFAATRDLYVFSDTVHERSGGIALAEPAFNARLLPPVLNPEIARIAEAVQRGEDVAADLKKWTADAMRWMPEAHLLRDFFLENASHVGLYLELRKSFSAEELAADGIVLDVKTVDLREHLDEKDNGVLKRAYMTTYPIIRVKGLETASRKFSVDQKKAIADYLTDRAGLMTAATGELFERMATELEIDALRAEYRKFRDHLEPKGRELTNEQRVAAGQKAFDLVLKRVVVRFPRATQHRDSILTSLMSDLATTSDQAMTIEKMTYAYYVRHPGEDGNEASEAFSATETVKNYLALFQDASSRRIALTWFFGGTMPEDRLIEGEAFGVNEQEKVDAFWMLSGEERRAIFYSALLGEHGLFECQPFNSHNLDSQKTRELHRFVSDFYDDNFAELFPKERTSKAFRLAFVEAFTVYTPARRVELLLSLADRMRELKMSGEKLTPGEAIRLLLEQVGVVGVKTGQVLSEQRDVLPDDMRSDLSSLKDRATPFNKQGVFTYLRGAGWYVAGDGRAAVSEVGEIVGSASIKQVHRVRLESGEELALKVQRPRIERYFDEDMRVLGSVVKAFRREGYDVPQWLLPEVRRVVEAEMDFGREARSSRTIGESLARRGASLNVGGRDLPLSVPEIRAIHTKETDPRRNMQLMMESFAHGLTLEDVRRLQAGEDGKATGEKAEGERDGIREKLRRLYGDVAPAMERRYAELDLRAVQAQLAVELLTQIAEDQMFHADLHRGNAIVNLSAGHEGVSLIDLGSAGESKPEFLELSAHLLMLKQGLGSPDRVGEILATYAPANLSLAEWTNLVTETVAGGETVEDVFKEILARLLKATGGTMDQNLRYLLKALASAGGHFQALQERIMSTAMNAAMAEGATSESRQMAVLMSPEVQKLLPLLPRVPFLAAMVGI